MRLFAAVLPPPEAVAEVAEAARDLHALPGAARLRWNEPADYHVTTAFYGHVDPVLLPALRTALAGAARVRPSFPLRLAGGGQFGDRALWAGVDGPAESLAALSALAAAAVEAGRATGVGAGAGTGRPEPAEREYHPHLTLARAPRAAVSLRPYVAALTAFRGGAWRAARLTLLRSDPDATGPHYAPLAAWPLGG